MVWAMNIMIITAHHVTHLFVINPKGIHIPRNCYIVLIVGKRLTGNVKEKEKIDMLPNNPWTVCLEVQKYLQTKYNIDFISFLI